MDDLYRDEILEHYRNPHNFGTLESPTTAKEGANPLCGDRITLMLAIDDQGASWRPRRRTGPPARPNRGARDISDSLAAGRGRSRGKTRPPACALPDRAPAQAGRSRSKNRLDVRLIRAPLTKRRRRVGAPAGAFAN